MALFNSPMTTNANHTRIERGTGCLPIRTKLQRTSMAQNVRCITDVNGPISSSAVRIARKEMPQIVASNVNSIHARVEMLV